MANAFVIDPADLVWSLILISKMALYGVPGSKTECNQPVMPLRNMNWNLMRLTRNVLLSLSNSK